MDKEKLKRFLNAFHDKYRTLIGSQVCEELMMKSFYYRLSKTDNFKSLFTEEIGIKEPIFDKIPFDVLFETTKGYISTIEQNSRYPNIQEFRLDYISLFLNKKLNETFDPKRSICQSSNENHLLALDICLTANLISFAVEQFTQDRNNDKLYQKILPRLDDGDNNVLHYVSVIDNGIKSLFLNFCWDMLEEVNTNYPNIKEA